MLRNADHSSFASVYVVCGYTDMRLGIDSLAMIIQLRYHLPVFPPEVLFLFCGRRATASVVSVMMNAKFANHQPLERQIQFFKSFGVNLKSNTAANWMINASEQYLSIIYDELHKHLYDSEVIHADETPFQVIRDDRSPGSKSYMWVYRNGECSDKHPVIIYDYQPTRKTDPPEEFLKDYNGVLVTDGYQVYHTLEKKREGLKVAGCWVHAKRKYTEIIKALGKEKPDAIIAAEAENRISKIFHEANLLDGLSKREQKNCSNRR